MNQGYSMIKWGTELFREWLRNKDALFEKNSKAYFLLKKIKDYEKRQGHHSAWSYETVKKYQYQWKHLEQKYDEVCIYGIEFVGIGETIPRLFMYLKDKKERDKKAFHVILPVFFSYYTSGIINNKIFEIFGKYIWFVKKENIDFWKYAVVFHSDKLNILHFDQYKYRDVSYQFPVKLGRPFLPFSNEVVVYAEKRMRQMGINGDYICLHARESLTKTKNFNASYDDTSILDADINSFRQACRYMQNLGYQVIRMGKDEEKICEIEEVVDYANQYYDEIMDFYLLANCKFMLAGMAGIVSIAAFWGRPVLQTNAVSLCYGQSSLPRTEYDLYIPKQFYSKREKKLLNLYEMLGIAYRCERSKARFDEEEIVLTDNTEEEIFEATKEMNEKLNHTWIYTQEEKQCMEKYWAIIALWKNNHPLAYMSRKNGGIGYEMMLCPICYNYLKNHLYLLDVKELYENR